MQLIKNRLRSKWLQIKKSETAKKAVLVLSSLLFCFILLELTLRTMPVAYYKNPLPVTEDDPIFRNHPNHELIYSKGWNFEIAVRRKVNSSGWVNDQEYVKNDKRPLIAAVGDSYVETYMNPYEKTFYGILSEKYKDRYRVYSFGMSGAQLSQYLKEAEYVRDNYHPTCMIIPIVANDFDESFYIYKKSRAFHYFDEAENSQSILKRVDRVQRRGWRGVVMKSSVARYLWHNLDIKNFAWRLRKNSDSEHVPYVGNVHRVVPAEQEEYAKKAIDIFFKHITNYSGLSPNNIIFILDGERPSLYKEVDEGVIVESYWRNMRSYFMDKARRNEFTVIDMQKVFLDEYKDKGKKFEFGDLDGHWNDYAHGLVAEEIMNNSTFRKVLRD